MSKGLPQHQVYFPQNGSSALHIYLDGQYFEGCAAITRFALHVFLKDLVATESVLDLLCVILTQFVMNLKLCFGPTD